MRWSLKHPSAHEQVKAYEHYGQEVPPGLIPPDLHDAEWSYWRAFRELGTERPGGLTTGPIPWSAIEKYAERNSGLDPDTFLLLIREMDDVYLFHQSNEK
ncbi:MAG: phage tail assembly chaperone [Alcaligenes pakistanensis]